MDSNFSENVNTKFTALVAIIAILLILYVFSHLMVG